MPYLSRNLSSPPSAIDPALAVLLCACAPAPQARLRRALGHIHDWDALAGEARRHNMAGLLYRHVADECRDAVPPEILPSLRSTYEVVARRSLRMSVQLLRLLRVLDAHGIRAVAFKGAVLSQQAYGDPGLRSFGDLDLLLDSADVLRARAVLAEQGFAGMQAPFDSDDDAVLLRLGREVVLRRLGDGLMVELHDQAGVLLGGRTSIRAGRILRHAAPIDVLGKSVPAPGADDLVLLQCVHGARHGWDTLEHIACLAAIVARMSGAHAWPDLLARASEHRALRKVLVGVVLACIVADLPVPEAVLARTAAHRSVPGLVEDALARLTSLTTSSPAKTLGPAGPGAWLARYEDTRRAALEQHLRRVFVPSYEDWESLRLPPRAFGLYYLWRPLRLTGKYARRARHAGR